MGTYTRRRYGHTYNGYADKRCEITNKKAGPCTECGALVDIGRGLAIKEQGSTTWTTRHRPRELTSTFGPIVYSWGCPESPAVPTAEQITVTYDHMNRDVVVVPDDVARHMRGLIKAGWREIPDVADGYSRPFTAASWAGQVTIAIAAAFGASPIPPDKAEQWRGAAEQARRYARDYRCARAFVVGESGWDQEARWWADYDNTKDLHLDGTAEVHGNGFRYGG